MTGPKPASRSSIFQLLKLSFGGSKTVELSISCYGKLPIYRDFIRNQLAGAEAQAFKQWLDRGMSRHWEAQDAAREYHFGAHALLLAFPGTGRAVLAYLWGSADNEGLRRFPFAFFVSLPASRGSGSLGNLDALAQFARRAQGWRQDIDIFRDVESLVSSLRSRAVSLILVDDEEAACRLRDRLVDVTIRAFAESLYGERAEAQFPALLGWLAQHRRGGGSAPLAVRLPGSALLPAVDQVELWCALLRDERGEAPAPFSALIPLEGEPGAGPVLLGRDPRVEDVLTFHPEMPGYELAEDWRQAGPGAATQATGWLQEHGDKPLAWLAEAGAGAAR